MSDEIICRASYDFVVSAAL